MDAKQWVCALCGRGTSKPAVLIGAEAVGPVCARRARLIQAAKYSSKGSRMRLGFASRSPRGTAAATTGDRFDGIDNA